MKKRKPTCGREYIQGVYCSSDGLFEGRGESGKILVEAYEESVQKQQDGRRIWIEHLIALGIKAAHPDDGFHRRDKRSFSFSYPYFNLGVDVGDMVALGDYDKFVVLVVEKKTWCLFTSYHYVSTIYNQ